jgi:hypothetical protein
VKKRTCKGTLSWDSSAQNHSGDAISDFEFRVCEVLSEGDDGTGEVKADDRVWGDHPGVGQLPV